MDGKAFKRRLVHIVASNYSYRPIFATNKACVELAPTTKYTYALVFGEPHYWKIGSYSPIIIYILYFIIFYFCL